ncbi:MAG: RteC domain-containing protein [Bacteroidales bacterium]|nr:RteC domain-containing protein [Bacteroidales bacterium]
MKSNGPDYEYFYLICKERSFEAISNCNKEILELIELNLIKTPEDIFELKDIDHPNVKDLKVELSQAKIPGFLSFTIAGSPSEFYEKMEILKKDFFSNVSFHLLETNTSKREKLLLIRDILHDFQEIYNTHPLSENRSLVEILEHDRHLIVYGLSRNNKPYYRGEIVFNVKDISDYYLIQKSTLFSVIQELKNFEKIVKKSDEIESELSYDLYPGRLIWRNQGGKSELAELVQALFYSKAINNKNGNLSAIEALRVFSKLFDVKYTDKEFRDLLTVAAKRKQTTIFIDKLRESFILYAKEKAENRGEVI